MKVRFISRGLMMLLVVTMSFLAQTVYAQSIQQERITISANKKPLEQVLEKLGKEYSFQVFYNTSLVTGITVSAKVKDATVEETLQQLLKNTNLQYNIKGKTIVITAIPKGKEVNKTLLSGVVVDRNGDGIPGVNVFTQDKQQGAASDIDGNFMFATPLPYGTVLNFTSIGMKPHTVVYQGEKTLKVVMLENINELETVVITGVVNKNKESFIR